MASYAGYDLGPVCHFQPSSRPVDWQVTSYAGVDGVQMNNLGHRGDEVAVLGHLTAADIPTLCALEANFRDLQKAGTANTLDADSQGSAAGGVLMQFHPVGEIESAPGFGVARAYQMLIFFRLGF